MSTVPDIKSVKILCLHGYRQNGEIFRLKTGSLRKLLKSKAELIYVTAPNEIMNTEDCVKEENGGDKMCQRSWWFTNDNGTFESKKYCDISIGLEESLEVVDAAFKEHGPFDGILGFSQGAAFVCMICGMKTKGVFQHDFKFAILVAGFKSRCSLHLPYYESKTNIPTLHVFGETDQVIPQEMSEELLQYFQDPKTVIHPGGHYVPAVKTHKPAFLDLFSCAIDIRNENS